MRGRDGEGPDFRKTLNAVLRNIIIILKAEIAFERFYVEEEMIKPMMDFKQRIGMTRC